MEILEQYLEKLNLSELGFDEYPHGWTKKSLKKYVKTMLKNSNAKSKEDFFDICVKHVSGKIDEPEAFCAALIDELLGTTKWRGKGKKRTKVSKIKKRT